VKTPWCIAFILALSPLFSFAQGQDLEPSEPDIVLPQMILEVEDMSVENIEARLPPEEELLPPLRDIPLPAPGEIEVEDPSILPSIAGTEPQVPAGKTVAADAALGIGMENTVLGKLSVKTLGSVPRLTFAFSHDAVDGFSGNQPGSGFDLRKEALSGGIGVAIGLVEGVIQGNYREDSFGLQGQSLDYTARVSRGADGSASFSAKPLEWLSFGIDVTAGTDTLTLNGPVPLAISEYRIGPRVSTEVRYQSFTMGLSSAYSYRWSDFGGSVLQEMHRVRTALSIGLELPASMFLQGNVAWFWSAFGAPASLFPFELRFSGTPVGFLTFSIGGGFAVTTYDAGGIISAYRPVLPYPLADDNGWYADASIALTPVKDLILNAKLSFLADQAMLDSAGFPAVNPSTGLFDLVQRAGFKLTADVGLQWIAIPGLTLGGSWRRELMDRPQFLPIDEMKAEGVAMEPSGAFGGTFSIAYRTGTAPVQLPILNIGGFIRVAESVQLRLDLEDLLQPALQGPRLGISPFVEPGFRVIARAQVSF
jgi:hypothetical protein